MQSALENDLERVASDLSASSVATLQVTVTSPDQAETRLVAQPDSNVYAVVAAAFGFDVKDIQRLGLGEIDVHDDESFADCGIEDSARLSVSFKTKKATFREVLSGVETAKSLLARPVGDDDVLLDPADESHVLGDVHWQYANITGLPESIGDLTIDGSLFLNGNQLTTLPANFGNITIGGSLYLRSNDIRTLPESFHDINVGGRIDLGGNPVAAIEVD